jgi:hypothetical protein
MRTGARLFTIAAALLIVLPSVARAGCTYPPYAFFPEKNSNVVVDSVVDAGSLCTHRFEEGPGYKFTSIAIEHAPEQGKLTKAGPAFVYTPNKGFTGKDAYLFKICATKGEQKGCSIIAFVATVK